MVTQTEVFPIGKSAAVVEYQLKTYLGEHITSSVSVRLEKIES